MKYITCLSKGNILKLKLVSTLIFLILLGSCRSTSTLSKKLNNVEYKEISKITNKTPYDPRPGMQRLRDARMKGNRKIKKPMHFLVFGDSRGSDQMQKVLKIADQENPQFCLTTADLVNKGADSIGVELYKNLDKESGWFFRKYPTWPTIGNHEVSSLNTGINEKTYASGVEHFGDFFGIKNPYYSFTYDNTKFIALDWIKVSKSKERLAWLEKELVEAKGMRIFIFKHRPYYTVGSKSYEDVEGKSTIITELFTKHKVTAVFSGHDHLYYRTERDGVNYIISSGAGAPIYRLKREKDAIIGDTYYGRLNSSETEYKFHSSKGTEVLFNKPMYFIVSVLVYKDKVVIKMIDTEGKIWEKYTF